MNQLAAEIIPTQVLLYLAIADDELCAIIQTALPKEYKTSYYKTINELFKAISQQQPALILCHNDLLSGNDTVLSSVKILTSARILMIGSAQTIDKQIAILKQGARGYFDCASPIEKLNEALYNILHGEVWVKRDVMSELIDRLTEEPGVSAEQRALLAQLTPKEIDVAQKISHGATNKMIAKQMGITERTVKAHLTAIFQKLAISDRLALAILFSDLRRLS